MRLTNYDVLIKLTYCDLEIKQDKMQTAASHAQFYLTDSTRHFLTGALYFNTKPNFDSLYPAIHYVRKDIRRIMETLRWQ